jgi:hypothetical protein
MGKTIGVFGYTIAKMGKSDKHPFNPIVHICLQSWSRLKDGPPTVTSQLMSEGEIDSYIESLKRDLDSVGRRAKAALVRAKESTRQIVSERVAKH